MIKNKIVIGIIPTIYNSDDNPYLDTYSFVRMYEERLSECGAIAIGLLNRDLDKYKDICDGYIWPGGIIIQRDFYKVFDDVLKNKKPLLGVCLGAQAIATYFNVLEDQEIDSELSFNEVYDKNKNDKLYLKRLDEDIINNHSHIVTKEQDTIDASKHKITIAKDSFMYDIYNCESIDVVSLHSYIIARTSNNILVSAKTSDGVIEAVEYHKDDNHILGVQYHPELIKDNKVFKWLIDNVKK